MTSTNTRLHPVGVRRSLVVGIAGAIAASGLFVAGGGVAQAAGGEALVCTSDGVSVSASDRDGAHGGYPAPGRTWVDTIADASKYNAGFMQVVPKTSGTLTWQNLRTGAHGVLRAADGRFADIDTGAGTVRLTADTTVKWGWGYANTSRTSCSGTYSR
ncbi:hypothetical protein [Tsukamurella sp. NPDC003166]|uniref:hypothetical protein n=1 Tax=Tsukamurella sp. NPDC003166 TaxID=3154444 RepID=UPI00339E90ED